MAESAGPTNPPRDTPLPGRRRRRGEARRDIIDAARALFAERGYEGTSLRDVAHLSHTSEALIWRSVGSKETLFGEAVLEPYNEFVNSFVERWEFEPVPLSNEHMMGTFVQELYDLLISHRELILALVSANAFNHARVHPPRGSILNGALEKLTDHAEREAADRGFGNVDVGLVVRSVVGMVMAMVLLDDWLLPTDRPDPRTLIAELTKFAIGGVTGTFTTQPLPLDRHRS